MWQLFECIIYCISYNWWCLKTHLPCSIFKLVSQITRYCTWTTNLSVITQLWLKWASLLNVLHIHTSNVCKYWWKGWKTLYDLWNNNTLYLITLNTLCGPCYFAVAIVGCPSFIFLLWHESFLTKLT